MMKSAYNPQWIYNLLLIKQGKLWLKHGLIQSEQFNAISESYKTPLFHPNIAIRILLFIATLIAASGVSGLVMLVVSDAGEAAIAMVCIVFGITGFIILERVFINKHHYKSGVTEGIVYMSCGFVIGGVAVLVDFNEITLIQLTCLLVFGFAAFRYLDLILTLTFVIILSWTIFYHCYEADGVFRSIIPFIFMFTFSGVYFFTQKLKKREDLSLWNNNILVLEVSSLLLIYAGGNYLVVREMSVNLMNLSLEQGQEIPYALFFYSFTLIIPVLYLFFGIKSRNIILIRVTILVSGMSVYTFKHYFLPDYTEVFLLVAGGLLIIFSIVLMRYLKEMRSGWTGENILSSSWANLNAEAFIISQTMEGHQPETMEVKETGGGGSTGGGGASTSF